jgi:hypothetical protein
MHVCVCVCVCVCVYIYIYVYPESSRVLIRPKKIPKCPKSEELIILMGYELGYELGYESGIN